MIVIVINLSMYSWNCQVQDIDFMIYTSTDRDFVGLGWDDNKVSIKIVFAIEVIPLKEYVGFLR